MKHNDRDIGESSGQSTRVVNIEAEEVYKVVVLGRSSRVTC